MKITYEQAIALGGVIADEARRLLREGNSSPPITSPARSRASDGMNKTERAFWQTLQRSKSEHVIVEAYREPAKLKLAGNTWYTPDFMVIPHCETCFVEVKGFMRDDASVKLKVAAETYPSFRWLLVTRSGRHGWEVREVGPGGIGRHPIEVPWIRG